jgi:hypothetical protein
MLKCSVQIFLLGFLVATSAGAEDKSVVSSAREVAKQGLLAYDAGRYDQAVEMLNKAYQVVHVPTLALGIARAYAKLGKLVAASEMYLEASRIPKDPSWMATQDDAVRDALKERSELLPRIPRLKILVDGARADDVELTVDGTKMPAALIGSEQLLDPGEHKLEAHRGKQVVTRAVTLGESERREETLLFAGADTAAELPASPKGSAITEPNSPPGSNRDAPHDARRKGSTQRLMGWLGVGVGGATLAFGSVTGILALSKRSSLRDTGNCSSDVRHCSQVLSSDVDSFNTYRDLSTVGFVVGGVLAATGVTLLLTAPKSESQVGTLGLWVGPNGVAIQKEFR